MDALYIHIPFCDKKCLYCDFWTFINMENEIDHYVSYLIKEFRLYPESEYDTVYFGGGTPSLLSVENFKNILEEIKVKENSEITVEINPKNLSKKDFLDYKKIGINRLSIGIQSFQDHILKSLGRNHTGEEALRIYSDAREAGFDNITVDLMFGIPGQTLEDLYADLEMIKEIEPDHISIYSLIWENGTYFWAQKQKGIMDEIDNDTEAEMYEIIIETLSSMGYTHYEISNFAKKNKKARHNTKYWENKEFIGLGLNSASNFENKRYTNIKIFHKYYKEIDSGNRPVNIKSIETVDDAEREKMKIILGLRLLDTGIEYFENEKIELLIKKGLLKQENNRIKLTKEGIMLANDVFVEFV